MKTNRIILAVCLMAAFACLFSCAKKEEGDSINATMDPLVLDDDDANAKMYIDFANNNYQRWNAFDKIMVYNLDFADGNNSVSSEFTAGAEAEGTITTQFHGPAVGPRKDGYFFFYPSSMAGGEQLDVDNREYFEIPGVQHFTKVRNPKNTITTTIDPSSFAMACTGQTTSFTMRNIFGVARLYLYTTTGQDTIKKVHHIELEDLNVSLVGDLSLKLHEVDPNRLKAMTEDIYNMNDDHFAQELSDYVYGPLGYEHNGTSHIMTLDCHNYTFENVNYEGVEISDDGANRTSFFFGLRPGALANGFTIRIYFTDHSMVTLHDWETESYSEPSSMPGEPDYVAGYMVDGKRAYTIRPGRIKAIKPHELDTYADWGEW